MTISAYQVDNVIKAYNKQSKKITRLDVSPVACEDRYRDVVTLSGTDNAKIDAYKKISYSLLDVLAKDRA